MFSRYPRFRSSLSIYRPTVRSKTLAKVSSTSRVALPPLELNDEMPAIVEEPKTEILQVKSDPDIGDFDSPRIGCCNQKQTRSLQLPKLPPLPKATEPSFKGILMRKIDLCKQMCDFENPMNDIEAKTIKSNTLIEITSKFSSLGINTYIDEETRQSIMKMIKINLLRPRENIDNISLYYSDLNSFRLNDFEHMQHVYKLLLFLYKDFPKYEAFDINLLNELIPVLSSRDFRERDQLVGFYANIIKANNNLFQQLLPSLIHIIDHHFVEADPCAVYSSLSIIRSILKDFPQHWKLIQNLFQTHFLNLLRCEYLKIFVDPLKEILHIFYMNNSTFSRMTIQTLLNIWPISNGSKEEILFGVLTSALDFPEVISSKILIHIIELIARSVDSPQHKIAEEANKLLILPTFTELVSRNRKEFTSILLPHIEGAKNHWNDKVRALGNDSFATIQRLSPNSKVKKVIQAENDENKAKLKGWASIARTAASKDKEINLSEKLGEFSKVYGNGTGILQATPSMMNLFPLKAVSSQTNFLLPSLRTNSQALIMVN